MTLLIDTKLHFGDGHHHRENRPKIVIHNLNLWYPGDKHALKNVNLEVAAREVTAFIGPSGCGKSTLLRCLNRMNDQIDGIRIEGDIHFDGDDIYNPGIDLCQFRRHFGWVAQVPNPFPKSVYNNVAYGARIHGLCNSISELEDWVEECLVRANLWDEVKDRLTEPGTGLSGGQMQRLCIARALAQKPEVLLMDEPCSALDPVATAKVEDLIDELKANYTIVIITHNMQQAARISQRTAFFHLGELLEVGDTEDLFLSPQTDQCMAYITGKYG